MGVLWIMHGEIDFLFISSYFHVAIPTHTHTYTTHRSRAASATTIVANTSQPPGHLTTSVVAFKVHTYTHAHARYPPNNINQPTPTYTPKHE